MTRAAQLAGLGSLEGSAPAYACRAWVNFNGTGTVAIRGSNNVSSITDNGTGDYTVNFASAMPDNIYSVTGFTSRDDIGNPAPCSGLHGGTFSTTAVRVQAGNTANVLNDALYFCVAVFR